MSISVVYNNRLWSVYCRRVQFTGKIPLFTIVFRIRTEGLLPYWPTDEKNGLGFIDWFKSPALAAYWGRIERSNELMETKSLKGR